MAITTQEIADALGVTPEQLTKFMRRGMLLTQITEIDSKISNERAVQDKESQAHSVVVNELVQIKAELQKRADAL